MSPLDHPESNHELVTVRRDAATGLHAIIAIHDRTLGPAIGGCRILPYATVDAALTDVLRLARGMTYKCAIGGIPYGGGKAVVIADPATDKDRTLLHAMGDFVDTLGGRYITSYDSGSTLDDIRVMGERTAHVAGYAPGFDNASLSTAIGVLTCIDTAWRSAGNASLAGARVAIQGMGNVGWRLADLLHAAGARLLIADVDDARVRAVAERIGADVMDAATIHSADVDIFVPCALGAILNERTIPELKAKIVAGGANNQLATAGDAARVAARDILYCPDFLVNAGGIIELHHQRSGSNPDALARHLASLGDTLNAVITRARAESRTTVDIAERIAEERIASARQAA